MWFELQICTGQLQGQSCEVLSVKNLIGYPCTIFSESVYPPIYLVVVVCITSHSARIASIRPTTNKINGQLRSSMDYFRFLGAKNQYVQSASPGQVVRSRALVCDMDSKGISLLYKLLANQAHTAPPFMDTVHASHQKSRWH